MADSKPGVLERQCIFFQCRRDADPGAPWGMGFCEEHQERAKRVLTRLPVKTPRRQKPAVDRSTCTACGHPYTADNPRYSGRKCRVCKLADVDRYKVRQRKGLSA